MSPEASRGPVIPWEFCPMQHSTLPLSRLLLPLTTLPCQTTLAFPPHWPWPRDAFRAPGSHSGSMWAPFAGGLARGLHL